MDFEGQKLADRLSTFLLWIGGVIAFVVGFYLQNIDISVITFGGFVVLTLAITLPDWPFYNKHPIQWADMQSKNE